MQTMLALHQIPQRPRFYLVLILALFWNVYGSHNNGNYPIKYSKDNFSNDVSMQGSTFTSSIHNPRVPTDDDFNLSKKRKENDWLKSTILLLREVLGSELVLTAFRWGIAFKVCMAILNEMPNILDDAALSSEDNPFPFRNLEVCIEDEEEEDSKTSDKDTDIDATSKLNKQKKNKKGQLKNTKEMMAHDVALKLRAAGLPTQLEVNELYSDHFNPSGENRLLQDNLVPNAARVKSVEEIVKSLTRTEIALLNSSLLTPISSIDSNQSSSITDGNDMSLKSIGMDDVGGLDMIKDELSEIIYAMSNPHLMSGAYGSLLNAPKGLLLYGPPGCGKTMLARALSKEAGARFLCIAPSNLLRKYVGETNQMVKALFSLAKKLQPCVIFMDEIDATFRERSSEEHDVTRDLKTEFMQLWDGLSSSSYDRVLVMGATNRPFDIDSAFRRRLVKSFYVGIPNYEERIAILQTMLRGIPLENDFNIERIAGLTEAYTPSDLKEVLRAAALIPLREARLRLDTKHNSNHINNVPLSLPGLRNLSTDDVLLALHRTSPTRWSQTYRQSLEDYTQDNQNFHSFDASSPTRSSNRSEEFYDESLMTNRPNAGQQFFSNDSLESSYDFDSQSDDEDSDVL